MTPRHGFGNRSAKHGPQSGSNFLTEVLPYQSAPELASRSESFGQTATQPTANNPSGPLSRIAVRDLYTAAAITRV